MPELPEVEITRRGIDAPLRGARVLAVHVGKPLRWPLGCEPSTLIGTQLGAVGRRGKYLWLQLQRDAHDTGGLLLHLGMSGSLALSMQPGPRGAHDHFELHTTRGSLRLTDPRRFGAVVWSPSLDDEPAASLLRRLGLEPFDTTLTDASFHAALRARRTPIKALLLSGEAIVGAGNIYACEALFEAGIDPRTRAGRLSLARCERLADAIRKTLARAMALGGSTLRDFHDAHGMAGAFQLHAQVYDREHQECRRCGGTVRRIVQGQRASYFCGGCQRR